MKRRAGILLCTVALSACGTVAPKQKAASQRKTPEVSRRDEIRNEIKSLEGNYDYAGLGRFIGFPGWLALHGDGSFVFYPSTCDGHMCATYGAWHPEGDRIDMEGDDEIPEPPRPTRGPFRISYESLSEATPHRGAWLNKGFKVVRKNGDVFLYPLDPAFRRDIIGGGSVWPMRKTGKPRGFEHKKPR